MSQPVNMKQPWDLPLPWHFAPPTSTPCIHLTTLPILQHRPHYISRAQCLRLTDRVKIFIFSPNASRIHELTNHEGLSVRKYKRVGFGKPKKGLLGERERLYVYLLHSSKENTLLTPSITMS